MSANYKKTELFRLVDKVYAQALYELALAKEQVQEVCREMEGIVQMLQAEGDVIRLLASRTLSLQQRDECCVKAFGGRVSELVLRFLRLLVKKNRFDELPSIGQAFLHLVHEEHGDIEVWAITATGLSLAGRDRLVQRTQELTGRNAVVSEQVEPAMVGGMKVRIGDVMIDGSVATQLRLIKEALEESGRGSVRKDLAKLIH